MCSIVSLCEITHHGLHEWKWKHGGGLEQECAPLKSWERDCVDSQIKAPAVCVRACVLGGRRDTDFMHH